LNQASNYIFTEGDRTFPFELKMFLKNNYVFEVENAYIVLESS